jgi:drug/metabolite transporter (DMT)-like permease
MTSLTPDRAARERSRDESGEPLAARAPGGSAAPPISSWLPAFSAVALIWGTSFMFIKIVVVELPPAYLALARVALGALTLVIFMAARRQPLPRDRRIWPHLFLFAVFGSTLPFMLFGYAEQHVASVLAGIWNGTVPLTTLAVTLLVLRIGTGAGRSVDRPTRQQITGLLLGFAGVLVVLGVWRGIGGSSLVGQLELLGAVSCYGIGFNYSRWILGRWGVSALQLSAGQLLMSTFQLLVLAPLLAGAPPSAGALSPRAYGAVAVLGILGTGLAFVLNYHVVNTAGVTTGSMVTYGPPVVGAIAGVALLHEHLAWNHPVGGAIVLLGVAVSQNLLHLNGGGGWRSRIGGSGREEC